MSTKPDSRNCSLNRESARVLSTLGNLPLSRREAVRRCLFGAAGLLLADGWGVRAFASARAAQAKSVIQIWMWGGPCHIDTFDPKPDAGYDYCGALAKAIPTNVDGIQIGESLPLLAKQAHQYSLLRGMTH